MQFDNIGSQNSVAGEILNAEVKGFSMMPLLKIQGTPPR